MYWTVSNNLCLTFFSFSKTSRSWTDKKKPSYKNCQRKITLNQSSQLNRENPEKRLCYPFKQQFLQSVYQIHTMTYLQEHTCYLSTRKGLIFRWCKSTRNTRLGYKVCVKKSKGRKPPAQSVQTWKCRIKQSNIA